MGEKSYLLMYRFVLLNFKVSDTKKTSRTIQLIPRGKKTKVGYESLNSLIPKIIKSFELIPDTARGSSHRHRAWNRGLRLGK